MWQTDLHTKNDTIYTDFKADIVNPCINGPVLFAYLGSTNFDSIRWNFGPNAIPSTANSVGPHSVVFNSLGKNNISVTAYKNGYSYSELKNNYIDVGNNIEFEISPFAIAACPNKSENIYVTGNYNYSWSPSTNLNQNIGNNVVLLLGSNTTLTVTGTHGECSTEKEIVIQLTPDNICDAIELSVGLNGPFTNICATPEADEPVPPKGSNDIIGCESQDGWCLGELEIENSVWFKFIVPYEGNFSVESPGFDDQVAIYKASTCNDLFNDNYILLAANDDFPTKKDYSAIIANLNGIEAGDTLWIQVDGSQDGVTGYFYIQINPYIINDIDVKYDSPKVNNNLISIFPNPNRGIFTLRINDMSVRTYLVNIYNVNGQKVFENRYNYNEETLNLKHMDNGLYLIEVISKNKIFKKKLIIN